MQFRAMVNEISALIDGKVHPTTIKLMINRVIRELSSKALFDNNIVESSITLVASQEPYALPADFSREVILKHTNVLDYSPWGLYAQKDRTTDGVPTEYTIKGSNALVNPKPSAAAVAALSAVTLVYGKEPAELSADTTEPPFPRNFHWVVKEGGLLRSLKAIPPKEDPDGRYAAMIPLTESEYFRGIAELITSEANKGRLALSPRG